jgi:hypothetical protein
MTLLVGSVWAQPASITSTNKPVFGPGIFDAAGNLYSFQYGPVTASAAQTQNGGGTCLTSNGFFGVLGPCSDAYINKVWGTYLGGSTADQSNALGSAPGLPCGVVQINLLVPTYVEPGVFPFLPWSMMALAGGAQSAAEGTIGVTISVK